jgi:hypothetical protein
MCAGDDMKLNIKIKYFNHMNKFYRQYFKKNIYIVNMTRWGSRENHSYFLSCYSTIEKAYRAAEIEVMERGGKYDYEIIISEIDSDSKYTIYLKYNKEICNYGCDDKKCNVKNYFKNYKPK